METNPNIVVFGVGAIGSTVGGWLASVYDNLVFIDQGEISEALMNNGLTIYHENEKDKAENIKVKVVNSIDDAGDPDIIIIAVKTYSLDKVCKLIKEKVGDKPIIIALQNGIDNQKILPKYFSKVIYGIVSYNAWLDAPGIAGYQKRGPLIFGTINNELDNEMKEIQKLFNKGVETVTTNHLQDAARSKMIINLTNSLTTLIGLNYREISNAAIFQKLLSNLTYEGVQIMKAAGYNECKLGGMPSWAMLTAAVKLPRVITKKMFEKNVKKMVLSSMAQDVIQRGSDQNELDNLNGYFVNLADELGMKAPYNRAVYELCKSEFSKPDFKPVDVMYVWDNVKQRF